MISVMIYGIKNCCMCSLAKDFLRTISNQYNLIVTFMDLDENIDSKQHLTKLGFKFMPVIRIGDKYFDGFNKNEILVYINSLGGSDNGNK